MAKRRTTPMPTIVHTMLVRVGSTVCCGKVGSAGAGSFTSGSGGTEPSARACSGTPASGLSTLMAVPSPPFRRSFSNPRGTLSQGAAGSSTMAGPRNAKQARNQPGRAGASRPHP
jgi:hypothetical protein